MSKAEITQLIRQWSPASTELIPPLASAGLSGASFYTIPNYYASNQNNYATSDGVLKVGKNGQPGKSELRQLNLIRETLGPNYEQVFVPAQLVNLGDDSNVQGLISPKFVTPVAEFMRRDTPPQQFSTSVIFDNLSEILGKMASVSSPANDNSLCLELTESLYFVANILDTQIEPNSPYQKLPTNLITFAKNQLDRLVPMSSSLSANDAWLGNVAIINSQNEIRLFDPLPTLPMVGIDSFTNQLKGKNINSPEQRNTLIDYGRVSVNLTRFIQEWRNKGWEDDAKYLEETVLPKFREQGIATIGEQSLMIGELINNAYFSVCNCETCTINGFLNLAYQELDRLINQLS